MSSLTTAPWLELFLLLQPEARAISKVDQRHRATDDENRQLLFRKPRAVARTKIYTKREHDMGLAAREYAL